MEQLRLVYASNPPALAASVVCAVTLAAVEWEASPRLPLLAWLTGMTALTICRYLLIRRFQRVMPEQQTLPVWKWLFLAGAALAGLGWGSTMFLLLPESSIPHQVFLVFMLGGITAGAVSTLSARLDAFLCFAIPVIAPVAGYYWSAGGPLTTAMASMIIVFALAMLYVAAQMHTTVTRSLTLQLENAGLLTRTVAHARETETTADALRESEERYRLLVDQATDIIYRTDVEGRFLFLNPTAMRLSGYAESELLGRSYLDFIRPDYRRRAERFYMRQFAGRVPTSYFEFPGVTKDGREIWLGQHVRLLIEDGRITGFSAVARDITERRSAEERLRRSEAFLSSLIENLPDMIFVKDAKTLRFVRINKAGEDLLGLSREALIGKNDYDFFPKEQADHFTGRDRDVLAGGRLLDIPEESIQTTDKGTRILHTKKIPLLDDSGRPQYLLGISEDTTETKQAERALRESEERFRQLAGRIKEVFWMSDVGKRKVLYVSPAYEEIWGRSLDSLYAAPRSWLEAIHPDDRKRVLQAAMTKQSTGEYDEEYRILRPDGSVRWIRDQGFPVQDDRGRVYRVAGIARDITERKRAEEALATSEKRLRTILEAEPECVKVVTEDGVLLEMNTAGLAMIEADSLEEVIGRSVCLIIAPPYREAFLELNRRVYRGQPGTMEFEIVGLKGTRRWLETHAVPFRDEHNAITAVLAITRDVTKRRRAEDALRAARQEREQLARNLHDSIIQSIYAIGLTVEESQSLVPVSPAGAMRKLDQVVSSLNRVIREVRGYLDAPVEEQPETLTAEELLASFEHLGGLMEHAEGVRFAIAIAPDAARALTGSQRAQCLYVAQEAMSNSLRHSRASTARVSLACTPRGVRLEVRDNGVGFALADMRNGRGGLKNIRLRARKIGANLDIASHLMGGTVISLEIPKGT
jgi:PAS domain S-box-containing protein